MSPWVALPIKGERSGLTRLFPPFVFPSLPPSANLVIVILIFLRDRCGQLVGDRRLGSRSPVCHLVCPCRGRPMCAPFGPRVVLQGCRLGGFLLLPSPWSGLVGLASPGGFGSGRSAPGAPPPGLWGSPPFCFAPPSFLFVPLFCRF